MIREDRVAERIAIETYREMVSFFGQKDPTSRRLIEEILATEEEHASAAIACTQYCLSQTSTLSFLFSTARWPLRSIKSESGTVSLNLVQK
jgi:hypothetical protein